MSDDVADDPAENAGAIGRALKERWVRHPLRDNDLPPAFIPFRQGEPIAICHLPSDWTERYDVLRDAVTILAPDEVVIVADTAALQFLNVVRMTAIGAGEHVRFRYTYVDGAVVWSEGPLLASPDDPMPTIDAQRIADALMTGFKAEAAPYEADQARAALGAIGMQVRFPDEALEFVNVEPDDPCKCGSGLKYKDCHGF